MQIKVSWPNGQAIVETGTKAEDPGLTDFAMFKGTYHHRIDPKGRVPVPAAFRRDLEKAQVQSLVVTLLDQCGFAGCNIAAVLLSDAATVTVGP